VAEDLGARVFVIVREKVHVGSGGKAVTASLEVSEPLDELVQLAVTHYNDAAILIVDRLVTALDIDDGEAPHAEYRFVTLIPSFTVRTAMHQTADGVTDAWYRHGPIDTH